MSKNIDLDNVEENDENSSDDSNIEIKPKKPRKKAEYIFTDARKEAFEKARQAREIKRDERKLNKKIDEEIKLKELNDKILLKAEKIKKQTIKREKILNISDDDDEPVIIVKKKPKKKVIVVQSDSEEEVIVKKKKEIIKEPIKPIKRYIPIFY